MAQIATIGDLCQRLREAAVAGDWESATSIEQTLRGELEAAFAAPASPDHVERLTVCASDALSTIAEVTQLASQAREEAAQQLAKLDRGRRARKGYSSPP